MNLCSPLLLCGSTLSFHFPAYPEYLLCTWPSLLSEPSSHAAPLRYSFVKFSSLLLRNIATSSAPPPSYFSLPILFFVFVLDMAEQSRFHPEGRTSAVPRMCSFLSRSHRCSQKTSQCSTPQPYRFFMFVVSAPYKNSGLTSLADSDSY